MGPWVMAHWTKTALMAGVVTFLQVFLIWTLCMIAHRLEHPFGDDSEDIDMKSLKRDMILALEVLLTEDAAHSPKVDSQGPFWAQKDSESSDNDCCKRTRDFVLL